MINKVILIGHLGADPEKKEIQGGYNLAKFSMATSEKFKSGNELKVETQWHFITCWQGRAEFALKYLKKGDLVYIEGKLKYRAWETDKGEKRYSTEIHANVLRGLTKHERAEVDTQGEESAGALGTVQVAEPIAKAAEMPEDDLPF